MDGMGRDETVARAVWNRDIQAPLFALRCECGWQSDLVDALALVPVACARCGASLVVR